MKAVLSKVVGGPETLVIEDIDAPALRPGGARVQVKAVGINFPDVLIIEDKYQSKPPRPFAPGGEVSGIVTEIAEGVTEVKVGDRVLAQIGHGGLVEEIVAPAGRLTPIPDAMPYDEAAAFILTYGTSYHALKDRGELKPGETLLVLGAAGGVGLAAVEIGKAFGAKVIAAASTEEKLAVCREHGADMTINYETEDLRERLKELTDGKGPDVIYDPVGGKFAEPAFRSIGWRGRFLVVGFANGEIPRLPLNLMLLKGASVVGVFWGQFCSKEPQAYRQDVQEMFELVQQGKLRPHISARYPLAQGAQAINDMMNRKVMGKVIITP